MRATIRITGLAIAGFALAACATTAPPPVVAAAPAPKKADSEGAFKIGTPYQVDGKWYYPAEDYAYVQEGIASWYGQDFHGKRTANGEKYDMNAITAAHPTLPLPSVVHVTNLDNGRQLTVRVNDRGPFHSSRIIDVSRRAAQLLGFYDVGTAHVRVEIDATESLNLKNIALRDHPPEMPKVVAAPREAITSVALAPVTAMPNEVLPPPANTPANGGGPKAAPGKTAPPKPTAKPLAKLPEGPPTRVARADPGQPIPGYYIQAGAFADPGNAQRLEEQLRTLGSVVIEPVTVSSGQIYRVRVGPFANAAAAEALLDRVKSFSLDDAKVVRE
ncbi:MAG: septal ring lytic transglycosylase RlpA family protein [Rhodospirillaceae bacterium]